MPTPPLVVVVDDDPAVARLLEEILHEAFAVRSVTTSRAALDQVEQDDVAVLLADQRMPGMDGITLLSEARKRKPTLIGVLITGHAEIHSAIKAINEARVLAFLTKPLDPQELLEVMHRAVEAHHALEQLLHASAATERALQQFADFADGAPAPTTAQHFGSAALRDALPPSSRRSRKRTRRCWPRHWKNGATASIATSRKRCATWPSASAAPWIRSVATGCARQRASHIFFPTKQTL